MDEVLFDAKISPLRNSFDISINELIKGNKILNSDINYYKKKYKNLINFI